MNDNAGGRAIGVLCVDDNDFIAEAMQRMLTPALGFEWRGWLPDAEGLIEAVRERKPDVVLLDIDMPGADGLEVLRSLLAQCPGTRVIMLSGHVRREYIDKAVEAGAWGYLSKGERSEGIVAAVRQVAAGEFALVGEAATEFYRG
jgi:DNA-binding NarL/FixJ family response regulator